MVMGAGPTAQRLPSGVDPAAPVTRVVFVVLEDSLLLDWAGPAEALRIANQGLRASGRPARFETAFVGPETSARASVGAWIDRLDPLPERLVAPTWLVLVGQPGQRIEVNRPATQTLLRWLRPLRPTVGQLELMCVCAGALLAAHAGLLDGKKATTHHHHLDELQQVAPRCEVQRNRVFVQDGPVWTSAGVTTGIDLFLHRIAASCGAALAALVAQTLVLAQRRGPQDPELSPFLAWRDHLHAALHRVQDAVSQEPHRPWTVPEMARLACTSPRHLTRLFIEHAGIAPLQYLRRLRLHVADVALRSGRNVTQAADMAGFASDTQLRRAWRQFGMAGTPSARASPVTARLGATGPRDRR
jgi:transcriptional regulator GlxA family with amidase domain